MKHLAVFALLFLVPLAVTQGQEPPEQYPGQHRPGELHNGHPPEGWFCEHDSPTPEHDCDCKRMVSPDDLLCETEPDPRDCSVHCWARSTWITDPNHPNGGYRHSGHCACPVYNADGSEICRH